MNTTEKFSHLWNGSEPGWVVVRQTKDRENLQVLFSGGGPTMSEVKALRAVMLALSEKPAVEVLAILRGKVKFSLGELDSSAARRLRRQCEALGLRIESQGYQTVSHSFVNELSKTYLLIEDTTVKELVAEEALKQGLPLRNLTI